MTFDPENVTKKDMEKIADHIEEYLETLEDVMVIPEEILNKRDNIEAAIETTKKLIKRLKKGDVSVFKDSEEWNQFS